MKHIEFRNDLHTPISIRFLVTAVGNFYVDIEDPNEISDERYTKLEPHTFDILEVQPE